MYQNRRERFSDDKNNRNVSIWPTWNNRKPNAVGLNRSQQRADRIFNEELSCCSPPPFPLAPHFASTSFRLYFNSCFCWCHYQNYTAAFHNHTIHTTYTAVPAAAILIWEQINVCLCVWVRGFFWLTLGIEEEKKNKIKENFIDYPFYFPLIRFAFISRK